MDYLHLWQRLEEVQLQPDLEDTVRWKWSADGCYSAKTAYQALRIGRIPFQGADRIWKTWAPPRVNLFFWSACRRRIWTADRRRRRGLDAHEKCLLCDQGEESADHLLVHCPLSKEVWWRTLSWANCACQFSVGEASVQDRWEQQEALQLTKRRKGFNTLFMLTGWHIWKERNARLFEGQAAGTSVIVQRIKDDADLWTAAGAGRLGRLFCE
ncbi:hypothetical protein C2845_PM10G10510 [Panicum miliaceum]|uniref:Reverse transcriptase zinc-binding domain-containing protein n=1 Tax=Panicum miliaceum TaxID=4540 RepID=A0A3L6PCT3_PANMI|nr:hypothetical protein C2845_PM10G10510 [Panicum miliaceum]